MIRALIFLFTFLILKSGFSQAPNWSVNPSDYQYTANITAVIVKDSDTLNTTGNIVGGFINNEMRGFSESISFNNKELFFLTIYSNNASGDTILFHVYVSAEDSLYNSTDTLEFISNNVTGSPGDAYGVHLPSTLNGINSYNLISNLMVYPNPIISNRSILKFNTASQENITLSVIDYTGKLITQNKFQSNSGENKIAVDQLLNKNNLTAQSYFVVLEYNNQTEFYKISTIR